MLCILGLVLIARANYRRIIGGTLIGILRRTVGIPWGSRITPASCRRRPR